MEPITVQGMGSFRNFNMNYIKIAAKVYGVSTSLLRSFMVSTKSNRSERKECNTENERYLLSRKIHLYE